MAQETIRETQQKVRKFANREKKDAASLLTKFGPPVVVANKAAFIAACTGATPKLIIIQSDSDNSNGRTLNIWTGATAEYVGVVAARALS